VNMIGRITPDMLYTTEELNKLAFELNSLLEFLVQDILSTDKYESVLSRATENNLKITSISADISSIQEGIMHCPDAPVLDVSITIDFHAIDFSILANSGKDS